MKKNLFHEYITEFIDFRFDYADGDAVVRPVPKAGLDDDGVKKFWRLFSRYPNDFAASAVKALPKDVEFVSYDHLNNVFQLRAK